MQPALLSPRDVPQDFVPWHQLDPRVGQAVTPLCVDFFRGETSLNLGRKCRGTQPRKRRAPGADLPSGASRSFNTPDARGPR